MIYLDLYLRADTEADLIAALPFARWTDDDEIAHWNRDADEWALDLIGPMMVSAGTYDEAGDELTPPVIDNRFHANMRCSEAIAALVPEAIQVAPDNPRRVWA